MSGFYAAAVTTTRGLLAALALLTVMGCAAADSSELACDDFAGHARDGLPAAERAETVRSVGEVVGNADQSLQDAHAGLVRTVGGSDSGYQLAADTFAQACFDNGWTG